MLEGSLLTALGGLGIFIVVCLYPVFMLALPRRNPPVTPPEPESWPSVTMITAARNAAALLPSKLNNFRTLDYPPERLNLLIASDASTDATRKIIEAGGDSRIRLIEQTERRGKAAAMNLAVEQTHSELLLFSDTDALLAPDAVRKLARHFSDPLIGGVCGQRVAARSGAGLRDAQQTYISLDSALKRIESEHGRISSNDGKIHMIRRTLYASIPRDVSDDLYTLLSVVSQGFLYLFDPSATAEVSVPSRDAWHEIERRYRIVILSLTGIARVRGVLNPFRFGWFAIGLWINKIGRRLLPFFCLALVAGSIRLLSALSWIEPGLRGAAWIFVAAVLYGLVAVLARSERLNKPFRLLLYVLAGFAGTIWAVVSFLFGRRISSWEPKKHTRDST
jgi:cellulose synthase/poly-beta-1,6-N-acetylglucosamine synthase-like glycosyltransferase